MWTLSSDVDRRLRRGWREFALITQVLGWTFVVCACVPEKVTVASSPGFQPSAVHTIAVLPFRTLATPQRYTPTSPDTYAAPSEIRSQFRLPTGAESGEGRSDSRLMSVSHFAAEKITKMVYESLKARTGVRLIPQDVVKSTLAESASQQSSASMRERIKHVAERLQVDAVLVGLVRTYRERIGSKIGATPAAVGFEVQMVRPSDGKVNWTGEYYEEQKPLNEDLLGFIERRGAFVTAAELAEYGVQQVMKEFPVGLR